MLRIGIIMITDFCLEQACNGSLRNRVGVWSIGEGWYGNGQCLNGSWRTSKFCFWSIGCRFPRIELFLLS